MNAYLFLYKETWELLESQNIFLNALILKLFLKKTIQGTKDLIYFSFNAQRPFILSINLQGDSKNPSFIKTK